MFRAPRFLLGLGVSLLCLWLAFARVPFANLGNSLAGGNYAWLLPAVLLQLLAVLARSQRWVTLLGREARLTDAFWSQGVGYLFTNTLPLRMGEPARVAVMSDKCGLPFVQVAASALLERLLDVATIVVVLVMVLPWMDVPTLVGRAGIAFGVLVLVAIVLLLLMVRYSWLARRLLQSACALVPGLPSEKIVARWDELIMGLSPLTHPGTATMAIVWSVTTWALSIGVYLCVLRAFQPLGNLLEAAFMTVALSLAATVPSSPGFIGVFQLVGQQALVLPFGGKYDASSALAIALTSNLTYYVITTLLGVAGLWRSGESFVSLGRSLSSRKSAPSPSGERPVLER